MERVRHPEIMALEVGDLRVDGQILGGLDCYGEFQSALRRAIELLHSGQGATRSNGALSPVVRGFGAVFLAGGGAEELRLRPGLSGLPFPVVFGSEGAFAGVQGGLEWLRDHGPAGWVVDLGKSHLKIATPQQRWIFQSDRDRLLAEAPASPDNVPVQRRRLREFLALKLQFAIVESGGRPQAVICALPTSVSEDGTPRGAAYAGMRGDRALLPDALEMAGLGGLPLFVLNDAELAALTARLDPRLEGFRKVLVLTLGSGIGAALVHRGDPGPDPAASG